MKKKLIFILVLIICGFCYYYFIYLNDLKRVVEITEEESFYVDKYTVFGTHLNISACVDKKLEGNISLVLKNVEEEILVDHELNIEENKTCFYLSDKNNEGLNLDDLKTGKFLLLIKEDTKYYTLENNTDYENIEYYTITKNNSNNKINIDFNNYKNREYLSLRINKTSLPENIYDITIDPGHGGEDPGTSYKLNNKNYNESNLTLEISLLLKEEIENLGLKVKLTREEDIFLDNYGEEGRAVIPNEVSSKYSISIHLNSFDGTMNYGGVEVYTPNDINYDLANMFANNISEIVGFSRKYTDKIDKGVYYTYFTKKDIQESKEEMLDNNLEPYDIKVGSPYMFMIREVGGISTGAYIDGRNDKHGLNKYYNSNKTAEPYLIELGYMNYKKDLENIVKKPESFSKAIATALAEHLKIS